MSHYFVGVDPSTSSLGYAILNEFGDRVLSGVCRPSHKVKGKTTRMDVVRRIAEISALLTLHLRPYTKSVLLAGVEEPPLTRQTQHSSLILTGGYWATLFLLDNLGFQYDTFKPAEVKAAAGHGQFSKEDMIITARQRFGVASFDYDDEADALWVADVARARYLETSRAALATATKPTSRRRKNV